MTVAYLFQERQIKDVELLIKHLTGKSRLVPRKSRGGWLYNLEGGKNSDLGFVLRGLDSYFRKIRREKEIDGVKTWVYGKPPI
jgi:hypothetical protein